MVIARITDNLFPVFLAVQVMRKRNEPIVDRLTETNKAISAHLIKRRTERDVVNHGESIRAEIMRLERRAHAIRLLLGLPKYHAERTRYRDLLRNFELARHHEDPNDEHVILHVRDTLTAIEEHVIAIEGGDATF